MKENNSGRLNRRSFLKATGAASAAAALGGVATATPGREPGPKPNEVLVGVSAGAGDPRDVAAKHAPAKAEVVHTNETLRYAAVSFPEEAPQQALENYMSAVTDEDDVKYAEENGTYEALYSPNDSKYSDQYAPQQVNADAAWDTTFGSSDITIAVVDTGVQYTHDDLYGNFRGDPGYDFVDDDSYPYPDDLDSETHGTHVAGIAAAESDNGDGISGISNATLISGRALDESGSGSYSDIADAVVWAADQGADIVNMSLGGGGYNWTMKNAVDYADSNGTLSIAAAGNDGSCTDCVSYPAAYSEVMAVSATDWNDDFAGYSSQGPEVDIAAPGSSVLSTVPYDDYDNYYGTSMATPVVSGVAALTLSEYNLKTYELRDHLKDTADNIGLSSNKQGAGRVDASDAVETPPDSCGEYQVDGAGSGTLSDSDDIDCWSIGWAYDKTCRVIVELDGPSDADFDLYVNEGDGTCPTTDDYDYRGFSIDSQETIVIDNPDQSEKLYMGVDSWSGSGDYTLTVTSYST